jgi:transposase-like protein
VDLLGFLVDTHSELLNLSVKAGLEVMQQMLERERTRLCGPKRRKDPNRRATRYGYDDGQVVLGGRRVGVRKPRVRSLKGAEIPLPTYQHFSRIDPLEERTLEQMIVGVSTRNYARSLEPMEEVGPVTGTQKSSVSRRFVARTQRQLEAFLFRPLDSWDFPVLMLDGTGFGDHTLVVALGIDTEGRKHLLGVAEGSTENAALCRRLLSDLVERGLPVERARLVVIDGGKGLRKAVREVFGAWALVHRCQLHKIRNILEHLPKGKRAWVKAALRKAYASDTVAQARRRLLTLAASLQAYPGAAGSLHEGLEETLTLLSLGVKGALARTLCSTNPIENLQGTLRRVSRNVTRWRNGNMALRWAATGMLEAQNKFRRVKGYRDLSRLVLILESRISSENQGDAKEQVA